MKRTKLDFSNHIMRQTRNADVLIHHLRIPDDFTHSVTFINTCGVMAVTGDFGNWIFCREFHPSAIGGVSDHYWIEKLEALSSQSGYIHSLEVGLEEIAEFRKDESTTTEENEWLDTLESALGSEYEYIAACMDRPDTIEAEVIPRAREINPWLSAIFDAFEEICRRIKLIEDAENRSPHGTNNSLPSTP